MSKGGVFRSFFIVVLTCILKLISGFVPESLNFWSINIMMILHGICKLYSWLSRLSCVRIICGIFSFLSFYFILFSWFWFHSLCFNLFSTHYGCQPVKRVFMFPVFRQVFIYEYRKFTQLRFDLKDTSATTLRFRTW